MMQVLEITICVMLSVMILCVVAALCAIATSPPKRKSGWSIEEHYEGTEVYYVAWNKEITPHKYLNNLALEEAQQRLAVVQTAERKMME